MKTSAYIIYTLFVCCQIFIIGCANPTQVKEPIVAPVTATPPTIPNAPTETPKSVVDITLSHKELTTFMEAIKANGLDLVLNGKGPFTIFAPSNDAFKALPEATLSYLLNPETKYNSTMVMSYHIVSEKILSAALKDGETIPTLNGDELKITFKDGQPTVNGASIVTADIQGSNGVLHIINTVLMPPKKKVK